MREVRHVSTSEQLVRKRNDETKQRNGILGSKRKLVKGAVPQTVEAADIPLDA